MTRVARGRVLVAGSAEGSLSVLQAPISFWGGVDPVHGTVGDPRHPDAGLEIAGRVLGVPATVGSSSSSAVMLELIRERTAPAALLLGRVDPILVLGVVVARELGYPSIPVIELDTDQMAQLPTDRPLTVSPDGTVSVAAD